MEKICVVGLGTVGYPAANYIKEKGFQVWGYDIRFVDAKNFIFTNEWESVPKDIAAYIICTSTGLDSYKKADLSSIHDVCAKISKSNPNALVSIESTIPVGTCRAIAERFGLRNIAHCPHRYWGGDTKKHGVHQLRVLGAINTEALENAKEFYRNLKIPVHIVSRVEVAELSKVAENTYRFVHIAFAEESKMLCDYLGLDFEEVRKACNTKWNIEILEARDGVGGECLPKDTQYFRLSAKNSPLVDGAIRTDRLYKTQIKKSQMTHDSADFT
jgi:UDP-N-acetyl-D-mannosaminuronic acid dehydrogenase